MLDQTVTLCATEIDRIFNACLGRHEDPGVDGIMNAYRINQERAEEHRQTLQAMIDELPDAFFTEHGDSFLNLCWTRNHTQWVGDQHAMEQLLVLARALGLCTVPFPRAFWGSLPGGMPIVMFRRSQAQG